MGRAHAAGAAGTAAVPPLTTWVGNCAANGCARLLAPTQVHVRVHLLCHGAPDIAAHQPHLRTLAAGVCQLCRRGEQRGMVPPARGAAQLPAAMLQCLPRRCIFCCAPRDLQGNGATTVCAQAGERAGGRAVSAGATQRTQTAPPSQLPVPPLPTQCSGPEHAQASNLLPLSHSTLLPQPPGSRMSSCWTPSRGGHVPGPTRSCRWAWPCGGCMQAGVGTEGPSLSPPAPLPQWMLCCQPLPDSA